MNVSGKTRGKGKEKRKCSWEKKVWRGSQRCRSVPSKNEGKSSRREKSRGANAGDQWRGRGGAVRAVEDSGVMDGHVSNIQTEDLSVESCISSAAARTRGAR